MNQKRPLKILVITDPDSELTGLTASLNSQGHEALELESGDWDLIIGEKCGRLVPELLPYVDVLIKEVQKGKYARRPGARKNKKTARKGI
jgi:hypothetical protein